MCFNMGNWGLLLEDQHLLDRPLSHILARTAADKYAWLGAIQLAHRLKCDTRQNPIARMRESLANWLSTGECQPTTTDDDEEPEE